MARERPGCPLDRVVRLLAGPWTSMILWQLHKNGAMHFGALRRSLHGVSAKVLTQRLRKLEREGLIERTPQPGRRPLVTYQLSQRGRSLRRVLDALDRVALRWQDEEASRFAPSGE